MGVHGVVARDRLSAGMADGWMDGQVLSHKDTIRTCVLVVNRSPIAKSCGYPP